ncbi:MAG: helicase C-terminal domain-containing protein [Planctomycetia bacterium]|nr:helicase C-terminal domain-containing protein [Planctomycetia bacterium]
MTDLPRNALDVLGQDGCIARRLPHYECRDQQLKMAVAVERAIRDKHHLAVEAGTGVGKSFAYLVPAILFATEGETRPILDEDDDNSDDSFRRVVISTHTISLQEQLYHKDIPFLASVLPFEFTSVLVKGRSNYLCLRRLWQSYSKNSSLIEGEQTAELDRLIQWSATAADGSLSELNPQPVASVWDLVCCEQGNCLGRGCKYYAKCFYAKARRSVSHANLLIVNHALLFSDLALRAGGGSILPKYDVLIFDEAHTMEQAAADHLGLSLSQYQVNYFLNRLSSETSRKGILHECMGETADKAYDRVQECRVRAQELFDDLLNWLDARPGSNGRVRESNIVKNGLSEVFRSLGSTLATLQDMQSDRNLQLELGAARGKLSSLNQNLVAWLDQNDEGYVYWLERSKFRGEPRVRMESAPVDVGPLLRELLFSQVPSVIMTSATLSTGSYEQNNRGTASATQLLKSFQFFRSRIGLSHVESELLGSPFDYRRQLTLVMLKDIPQQNERSSDHAFDLAMSNALKRYIKETDGGAFVLFTNYSLMKKMSSLLLPWLAAEDMPFFSQGDGTPRTKMVEGFKSSERSVLFGTDSFWQGVDIPGHALRNVIITKLPFFVPDQPLIEARLDAITNRGGSPFGEYQLPQAILKFKQGFGRLIRSNTDEGIVVILDPRIHTKSYGNLFLRALPDCRVRVDTQ